MTGLGGFVTNIHIIIYLLHLRQTCIPINYYFSPLSSISTGIPLGPQPLHPSPKLAYYFYVRPTPFPASMGFTNPTLQSSYKTYAQYLIPFHTFCLYYLHLNIGSVSNTGHTDGITGGAQEYWACFQSHQGSLFRNYNLQNILRDPLLPPDSVLSIYNWDQALSASGHYVKIYWSTVGSTAGGSLHLCRSHLVINCSTHYVQVGNTYKDLHICTHSHFASQSLINQFHLLPSTSMQHFSSILHFSRGRSYSW